MSDLRELVDQWELVARKQRDLAESEKDTGLRASLISASNAWMTAADDLKKHMENTKCTTP